MTKNRTPWYQDDDFWLDFKDGLFPDSLLKGTSIEIDDVLSLTEVSSGDAVLDLCCGPGRHSLELARRGYRVIGVDRMDDYLREARLVAEGDGLEAEFELADMREFRRADSFDLAISMYTSFGYFEDPDANRRVLENIYASLKPEGRLVLETIGKERLAKIWQPTNWTEGDDGTLYLQQRVVEQDWSWINNRWIVIRPNGERKEYNVSHRVFSGVEMRELLLDVGFVIVNIYGGLKGTPYDHEAKRLVAVATK